MVNVPIIFEPEYQIGDEVVLKLNPELKMLVDFYKIISVSKSGEVEFFIYSLYDKDGTTYVFQPKDLIAITEVV